MTRPGLVVLLLTASLTGAAQSPPPRDSVASATTPTTPIGTGRISGLVVAAETGDPLRNARVVLSPGTADVPLVLTDAEGRFSFTSLPPGSYAVSAVKSGYAGSASAVRNAAARPAVLQVNTGAAISGVTISLVRGSAISGRILNELGDPIINTNVFVEAVADAGSRRVGERWTTQTNDLGDYRIGSLPQGDYVVSIAVAPQIQELRVVASGRVDASGLVTQAPVQITQRFADGSVMTFNGVNAASAAALANRGPQRLYFPNTPTVLEAEVIPLKAGEERPAVDLVGPRSDRLPVDLVSVQNPTPTALDRTAKATGAIRGRVLEASGNPLVGAEVRLAGAIRPLPPTTTDALGQYEFLDLPAGRYTVSARKNRYLPRGFGQQAASEPVPSFPLAEDEKRDRLDIVLPRTSAIEGRLTDEYGDPVEGVTIRPQRIRFVSGRRRLVEVPGTSSSRTDDLGRYRVSGLQPGSYVVAAYVGQLVLGQTGAADIPGYATTYFPGTPNPPELALVPVPVSQDVNSVDFALSRIATASVVGSRPHLDR